jgi:hypothetical protein
VQFLFPTSAGWLNVSHPGDRKPNAKREVREIRRRATRSAVNRPLRARGRHLSEHARSAVAAPRSRSIDSAEAPLQDGGMDVPDWAVAPILCAGTILLATLSVKAAPTRPRLATGFAWGGLLLAMLLLFCVYIIADSEPRLVMEAARQIAPGNRRAALAAALTHCDQHFYTGMLCALIALLTNVRALAIASRQRLGQRWRDAALGMYAMVGLVLLVIFLLHDSATGRLDAADSIERFKQQLLGKTTNDSTP